MRTDPAAPEGHVRSTRAGFSLVEALVVLVITAMTLSLLFSMTGRGVDAGFRIGRNALNTADHSIETETVRSLLDSVRLPLLGRFAEPEELPAGSESEFSSLASLVRPSPCGPRGTFGRLSLDIEPGPEGSVLTCSMNGGERKAVLDHPRALSFSYSEDGVEWTPALERQDTSSPENEEDLTVRERRFFVRLSDAEGTFEIVGRASSGRTEAVLASQAEEP